MEKIITPEVRKTLEESKNKKAAKPENISIELLKNRSEILIKPVCELLNKCIQRDEVSKDWKLDYNSSVYKKSDKRLYQN